MKSSMGTKRLPGLDLRSKDDTCVSRSPRVSVNFKKSKINYGDVLFVAGVIDDGD